MDRLEHLTELYLDGELTSAELAELATALEKDAEIAKELGELFRLDRELEALHHHEDGVPIAKIMDELRETQNPFVNEVMQHLANEAAPASGDRWNWWR